MKPQSKKSLKTYFAILIDHFSSCMQPVIPILLSGGLIKLLVLILSMTGLFPAESHTLIILTAISDALFYFLPIFVAYASARHFSVNPLYAISAVSAMLLPDFIALMESPEAIRFLLFPIAKVTYAYMVIPIILLVYVLKLCDRFFRKIMPLPAQSIFLPMCNILAAALIGIIAIGPAGSWLSNSLSQGIDFLYGFSPIIACGVFGFFLPIMISTGVHWVFATVSITTLAAGGVDPFYMPICLSFNLAILGSTAGCMLGTKNAELKKTCVTAGMPVFFTGISEPVLYGICIPEKTPMLTTMIGTGISGLFTGFAGVSCFVYAYPTLFSILMFADPANPRSLINAFISAGIAFGVSFALTLICYLAKSKQEAFVRD